MFWLLLWACPWPFVTLTSHADTPLFIPCRVGCGVGLPPGRNPAAAQLASLSGQRPGGCAVDQVALVHTGWLRTGATKFVQDLLCWSTFKKIRWSCTVELHAFLQGVAGRFGRWPS